MNVKVNASPGARLPVYATVGAAGCDVSSIEDVTIQPGTRKLVRTGLRFEIPEGWEAQVRSRSGLALNYGVMVMNSPGTIDSDFRGELGVVLYNADPWPFRVLQGDRIAQLVFAPVSRVNFVQTTELSPTTRDTGGYGSTGT